MEPKKKKVAKTAKKAVSKEQPVVATKVSARKEAIKKKLDKKKDKDIQLLADRLKYLRKAMGHTNADFFAYSVDISRAQYARYEQGEDLRFSTLMRLIKAFKMTPAEFFSHWGE